MSDKRSYLESLNAGRRRRPSTSIERLNRTLEELEGRLGDTEDGERGQGGQHHWQHDRGPTFPAYSDLAHTVRQARSREEEFASVSQIATELRSLREEIRSQGGPGVGREIAALRRDLERNRTPGGGADQAVALAGELERLSGMIERLAARGDDRGVQMLRREIDDIKAALGQLAREETVRSVGERWEDLDRRWDALASDLRNAGIGDPFQEALEQRLSHIENAVRALPESLSLRTLEDKLRSLAGIVENLDSHREGFGAEAIESIERRLDELSRAIVASTSAQRAQRFDPEPLERIEARIGALARQIEELQVDSGFGISGQIETISSRVDELAQRVSFPENAVEKLAHQIAIISDKLDTVPSIPDMAPIFRDLENRFDQISARMDERHGNALEQGQSLFRELEQRIEEMTGRQAGVDPRAGDELVAMMDRRFAEMSERLEQRVEGVDGTSLGKLENRLEDIARRLESTAQAAAGLDSELITSLQSQVTALSEHIMSPSRPLPEFEDLGPRLDYIERSILETRDNLMEAARQAAEDAVQRLGGTQDGALASELGQELRSLENLTRISDERNAKTFEAIHDTLIKIVDRLGSMEKRQQNSSTPGRRASRDHSLALDRAGNRCWRDRGTGTAAARKPLPAGGCSRGRERRDGGGNRAGETRKGSASLAARRHHARVARQEAARRRGTCAEEASRARCRDGLRQPARPETRQQTARTRLRRAGPERHHAPRPRPAAGRRRAERRSGEIRLHRGRPACRAGGGRGSRGHQGPADQQGRRPQGARPVAADEPQDRDGRDRRPVVALGALQLSRTMGSGGEAQVDAGQTSVLSAEAVDTPQDIDLEASASTIALAAAQTGSNEETSVRMAEEPSPRQEAAPADPAPMSLQDYAIPEQAAAGFVDRVETAATGPDEAMTDPLVTVPVEAGPAALREAAESGNPLALFEIGNRYTDGRGVDANPEEAAVWYEMAAELGLAIAQYKVGSLYEKGIGVERDVNVAESWYRLSADQGNAGAMHNLGVLLAMGATGPADNEEAARWFLQAAEMGVPDSQFNMGILTAKGIGMRQDLEEGYKWFAIVAQSGDGDAAAKRDEVAGMLSPEQLENAKAAAALWRVKTPDPASNSYDIPEAWTESSETTASIENPDVRKAVSDLQRLLNERGYDAGPVDGLIGQKTRNAIVAFQRDAGLEPNGEINQALVEKLLPER
jgi:localization factor PodJL